MNITKGQEVIIVGINNQARYGTQQYKGEITSIGRKWFQLECQDTCRFEGMKFSLEDGRNDGKGYISDWQVYESQDSYEQAVDEPMLRKQLIKSVERLDYIQLLNLRQFLNDITKP